MKHLSPRVTLAVATTVASFAIAPNAFAATAGAPSSQPNADTGVAVQAGQLIVGRVSSNFNICGGYSGCESGTGLVEPTGSPSDDFYISGAKSGGVFYRIGDGPWTPFQSSGDDSSVSAPAVADRAGELFLTTNDFPGSRYEDNQGTMSVETSDGLLESYSPQKSTAPVFTSPVLAAGQPYSVTVKGTDTTFAAALIAPTPTRGWAICGTPESAALFPSTGTTAGRVGQDAEFLFSFPQKGARCAASNQAALPKRQSALAFDSGNGAGYVKPIALPTPTGPSADHTYTYTVTGAGAPLRAKVVDSNYVDNNGQFSITVQQTSVPSA